MAEHPRQEIELSFGGRAYRVRPTFEIIVGIERELGQASRVIGLKLLRAEAALWEIASVVFNMLKSQPGAPDRETVKDTLMNDGYLDLINDPYPLAMFLMRAQRGHKEHEKEAASKQASRDPPLTMVS